MPPEALENLHRPGQIKREPFDAQEFERWCALAPNLLAATRLLASSN